MAYEIGEAGGKQCVWACLTWAIILVARSERTFVSALHWVAPPILKLDWSKISLHTAVLIGCHCVLQHSCFASIVDRQISCQIKHAVSRIGCKSLRESCLEKRKLNEL